MTSTAPDRPRRMRGQTFACVFIDERQDAEVAPVLRLVCPEVPAPDLPGAFRLQPLSGRDPEALYPPLLLAHLETLLPPDPRDPHGVDLKAFPPQQRRDPAVSIPRMLPADFQHFFAHPPTLHPAPTRPGFSRLHSSTSALSRRASLPSIPPYLRFHAW